MASLKDFNRVELLFPSRYLKAAELRGRDVTVTIAAIDPRGELQMRNGKKEAKPIVSFKESEKLWVLNITNARSIAKIHGPEVTEWVGKRITIYPTTTQCGGKEVEAVRVRERMPQAKGSSAKIEPIDDEPAHDEATGEVREEEPAKTSAQASGCTNVKYVYT